MKRNWLNWLRYAGVRALKTAVQTAVAMIPVHLSIRDVDWAIIAVTSSLADLCSLLTSLPGIPEEDQE